MLAWVFRERGGWDWAQEKVRLPLSGLLIKSVPGPAANILFGQPYEPPRYERVLAASGLLPDLQTLAHGDATEIGATRGGSRTWLGPRGTLSRSLAP